jgi:hypothetical protein
MHNVPGFVQGMARMAILRYAQERGHTVITERIVDEATAQLMPGHAERAMEEIVAAHDGGEADNALNRDSMPWSEAAEGRLASVAGASLRDNLRRRAEKKARSERCATVAIEHIAAFVTERDETAPTLHWRADALARLARAPEGFMREMSRKRIEEYAERIGSSEITLDIAEAGLAEARQAMEQTLEAQQQADKPVGTSQGKCPFANLAVGATRTPGRWTPDAERLLENVPAGYCRELTLKAVEALAAQQGIADIDAAFVKDILKIFEAGAGQIGESLPWDESARERIAGAPDMVRGMLIKEIESWAGRNGRQAVDSEAVEAVKQTWQDRGVFHLDPDDPRSRN